MRLFSVKYAVLWCSAILLLALGRVHFRVVTTNLAYVLGKLKNQEGTLLEQRSFLKAEVAKLTGKRELQHLSDDTSHSKPEAQ